MAHIHVAGKQGSWNQTQAIRLQSSVTNNSRRYRDSMNLVFKISTSPDLFKSTFRINTEASFLEFEERMRGEKVS